VWWSREVEGLFSSSGWVQRGKFVAKVMDTCSRPTECAEYFTFPTQTHIHIERENYTTNAIHCSYDPTKFLTTRKAKECFPWAHFAKLAGLDLKSNIIFGTTNRLRRRSSNLTYRQCIKSDMQSGWSQQRSFIDARCEGHLYESEPPPNELLRALHGVKKNRFYIYRHLK
jgi:hypothetical protein